MLLYGELRLKMAAIHSSFLTAAIPRRRVGFTRFCHGDEMGSSSSSEDEEEKEERAHLRYKLERILPNAKLRKELGIQRMRRSLGIDYGDVRTGVAVTFCGFPPCPNAVEFVETVMLKGNELIERLIQIAEEEKADEFIVENYRKSADNEAIEWRRKTKGFAGRLAKAAAVKGWRVFLFRRRKRRKTWYSGKQAVDMYAAMTLLLEYVYIYGERSKLHVPKRRKSRERLCSIYYSNFSKIDDVEYHDELWYAPCGYRMPFLGYWRE